MVPGCPKNKFLAQIKVMHVLHERPVCFGFLEKVYENALLMELKARGIKAAAQYPIKVKYKDQIVGEYFADLVVENQVIIELKTVDRIEKIHEAQLLNYLKATGIKVGLLVNFKSTKADIKRLVLDLPE
jgi:GxxExxY protein